VWASCALPREPDTLAIVESAIAEIAGSGYRRMTSSDSARAFEALTAFISNTVACLDVDR
jgi:hypothetical protein